MQIQKHGRNRVHLLMGELKVRNGHIDDIHHEDGLSQLLVDCGQWEVDTRDMKKEKIF